MKEVDSVEGDVEAGVPRSKATLGHEGAENIDVKLNNPNVPRSNATMGQEGADNIDVAAPGSNILSCIPKNKYAVYSGTSMSSPFVSGLVALLLAKHKKKKSSTPIKNVENVREHLIKVAKDADHIGQDNYTGHGLVNPAIHHSVYQAGFTTLPAEVGGSMGGDQSRFSGTPNQ